MKKITNLTLMLFCAFLLLSSCGGSDSAVAEENIVAAEQDEHHDEGEGGELVLNNGEKWTLDSTTNVNYKLLKELTGKYAEKDLSVDEMKAYGEGFQKGIEKLVKECSMQGPDHEALHNWLSPVMRNMAELSETADAAVSAVAYDSLRKQIQIFDQYFNVE